VKRKIIFDMQSRENEGDDEETEALDDSLEKSSRKTRAKREITPISTPAKNKKKKAKSTTPKVVKTPSKSPKVSSSDALKDYRESPRKREYVAALVEELKSKSSKIEEMEKKILDLEKSFSAEQTKCAKLEGKMEGSERLIVTLKEELSSWRGF
jgi:hypothetical protein